MIHALLVFTHVLGVILLFGTYIAAFALKASAERTRDRSAMASAFHVMNWNDGVATPVSIVLIVASGVLLAMRGGLPILGTDWIRWSLILWGATAVIFVAGPLRIQKAVERSLQEDRFEWATYKRRARWWTFWAVLSFILTLVVLFLMINK